jgi:hypothetical protein
MLRRTDEETDEPCFERKDWHHSGFASAGSNLVDANGRSSDYLAAKQRLG